MQTHTFYSYKGGVGRSLLVANMAFAWARLGKRVVIMDLDLEAPGMHHKLAAEGALTGPCRGLVEALATLQAEGEPLSLETSLTHFEPREPLLGSIGLIPAVSLDAEGANLEESYISDLARLDWSRMLFDDEGLLLFLDLQAQLEAEGLADILLIDARTGITQIGGVATAVLADTIVALTTATEESRHGTRNVLRAIRGAPRPPGREIPVIVPVLARTTARGMEADIAADTELRTFLRVPARPARTTLPDMSSEFLHEDITLADEEYVLMAGGRNPSPTLTMDYLKLLRRLDPRLDLTGLVEPILEVLAAGDVERSRRLLQLNDLLRLAPTAPTIRAVTEFVLERPSLDAFTLMLIRSAYGEDLASAAAAILRLAEDHAEVVLEGREELEQTLMDVHPETLSGLDESSAQEWLSGVAARMDSPSALAELGLAIARAYPAVAGPLVDQALARWPDSADLLEAAVAIHLRAGNAAAALALVGDPSELAHLSDAQARRLVSLLVPAVLEAGDAEWARALLEGDATSSAIARVARVRLLWMLGREREAQLVAAAELGSAKSLRELEHVVRRYLHTLTDVTVREALAALFGEATAEQVLEALDDEDETSAEVRILGSGGTPWSS